MSAPEVIIDSQNNGAENDVDMEGEEAGLGKNGDTTAGGLENIEPDVPEREFFVDYLKTPILEIQVTDENSSLATSFYAHQALVQQSPYLSTLVSSASSPIALTEDTDAVGSLLEYLYKKDYFPTLSSTSSLESDPTLPVPDESGLALLRHARIYTLAKKFQLPALATLAHRKIHLVDSTAKGEIAYARYVYGNTKEEDKEIRRPVAQFWATRSHVLRHEAEREFREMCLRFPQFGFDVLSMVLDAQERRSGKGSVVESTGGSARKRARVSHS